MAKTAFLHPFAKPTGTDWITINRGQGAIVWDDQNRSYIDAMGALWFCQVGYGRHEIGDAVAAQMKKISTYHCFDPFTNEPAEELATRLSQVAPMPDARVFFTSSGSEAVDSAMKLARIAQVQAGHPERTIIISRERGYHGVAYGGMSAQGLPLNQAGFGPLLPDVINVAADDSEAVAAVFRDHGDRVAAVIAEPVQGAGGVFPPTEGYLTELRRICDAHGAYLIIDEVICGFGRLGSWFGSQHYGVVPDMATFAKGVTSGYIPLGGVLVGSAVRSALEADPSFFLRHGFTYSGHATACAAGLANIDIIKSEGLLERAKVMGGRLENGLRSLAADGVVAGVRGDVAVFAVSMPDGVDSAVIRTKMFAEGVIPRALPGILTFCPPLVTTNAQVDKIVDALATVLG
jgi:adenosylmethionine-8-amino-7-oxononanoate aminotransferase